jgi:hypothetical protein
MLEETVPGARHVRRSSSVSRSLTFFRWHRSRSQRQQFRSPSQNPGIAHKRMISVDGLSVHLKIGKLPTWLRALIVGLAEIDVHKNRVPNR